MVVGDKVWYTPTRDDLAYGREEGTYTVVGVYPSRLLGGMTGYRIGQDGQPDFPAYAQQLRALEKDKEHA